MTANKQFHLAQKNMHIRYLSADIMILFQQTNIFLRTKIKYTGKVQHIRNR